MAFLHNNTLTNCNPGYSGLNTSYTCYQLQNGKWKQLNTLNKNRYLGKGVSTDHATYIFGGYGSSKTYEYLPKTSHTWILGKNEIPIEFEDGCFVALSNEEIFLISNEQILKFDTSSETFTNVDTKLKQARRNFACSFIPGTHKIIIAGGQDEEFDIIDSTEILHVQDDGKIIATKANPMNLKKSDHGIGLLNIQGEERIAVIGGYDDFGRLDGIETFNSKSGKWELSELKLTKTKFGFASVSVPNDFILSMRLCGQRNSLGSNDNLKIASAQFGEFPHMCTLMKKNSGAGSPTYLGGASLISPNVVLTAAKVFEYG